MLPKMSEEKTDTPVTFVSTKSEVAYPPKPRSYRKYVIIAVTGILMAAIILTSILVGMYFFTQAQKEIVKFSFNLDENTKQDVISDPNTNVVQFHVNSPDQEVWAVNDFNRDIQVLKIQTGSRTDCYVAPLNRTTATDPSKISAPSDPKNIKRNASSAVIYLAANTPIPDSSFLCKAAKEMCNGVSTYWLFPMCATPENAPDSSQRHKRCTFKYACTTAFFLIIPITTVCDWGCH